MNVFSTKRWPATFQRGVCRKPRIPVSTDGSTGSVVVPILGVGHVDDHPRTPTSLDPGSTPLVVRFLLLVDPVTLDPNFWVVYFVCLFMHLFSQFFIYSHHCVVLLNLRTVITTFPCTLLVFFYIN